MKPALNPPRRQAGTDYMPLKLWSYRKIWIFNSVEKSKYCFNHGLNTGETEPTKMKDYGFMQQRTIEDFDGHT